MINEIRLQGAAAASDGMPPELVPVALESEPEPQLNLSLGESSGETKRRAGPDHRAIAEDRAWFQSMHVEWRSKRGADDIVYAGVVGTVGQVKSLRCELKRCLLMKLKGAAEAHIEIVVVGAHTGIATVCRRAVVGEVTVAVDVGAGEKVKGMSAVVVED